MVPSGRLIVPSSAWLTPLLAVGVAVTMSGGHAAAQAPEHADAPFLSASNRYRVRPVLPTRNLPGIPAMVVSDTDAVPAAWPVAAELLACVAAGDAAALEVAVLEVAVLEAAGLDVDVLEPLEQAATTRPIPAAPAALAIQCFMMMLPLRQPARAGPRPSAPRRKPQPVMGVPSLLLTTHPALLWFSTGAPAAGGLAVRGAVPTGGVAGLACATAGAAIGIAAVATSDRVVAGAAAVLFGLAYGLCLVSGPRQAEHLADPDERGAVIACYHALAYLGFAAPYLVDGLGVLAGKTGAFVVLTAIIGGLALWTAGYSASLRWAVRDTEGDAPVSWPRRSRDSVSR
jgi:hypothetical protein